MAPAATPCGTVAGSAARAARVDTRMGGAANAKPDARGQLERHRARRLRPTDRRDQPPVRRGARVVSVPLLPSRKRKGRVRVERGAGHERAQRGAGHERRGRRAQTARDRDRGPDPQHAPGRESVLLESTAKRESDQVLPRRSPPLRALDGERTRSRREGSVQEAVDRETHAVEAAP